MIDDIPESHYSNEPLNSIAKDIINNTSNIERGSIIVSLLNSLSDDKKLLSSLNEILHQLKGKTNV